MNTPKGLIEILVVFLLLTVIVAVGMRLTLNQMEEMKLKNNIEKQEIMNTEETVDENENYYQEVSENSLTEKETPEQQTEDEPSQQEPEENNDKHEHDEFQSGQRFKVVDPYSGNQ